ncbi:MAG: hypothetical protein HC913_18720, partial [Microscillaceae bacterium]|nr:hypothetical protein [Microscillaceae bacterium]
MGLSSGPGPYLGLEQALEPGRRDKRPLYVFDYLDDVSGQYPHLADLGNPLAVALSNRTLEATNARNGQIRNLEAISGRFGAPISYIGF